MAERAVQTVKLGLKKLLAEGGTLQSRLSRFLSRYRITPHSTTGLSPASLLMNRRIRSRLDLMMPDLATKVHISQARQKEQHDHHARPRVLTIGNTVYITNFGRGPKLLEGTILRKTGPVSAIIKLTDGREVRRHQDHIRVRESSEEFEHPPSPVSIDIETSPQAPPLITGSPVSNDVDTIPHAPATASVSTGVLIADGPDTPTVSTEDTGVTDATSTGSPMIRRSSRKVRPPDRLNL